MITKFLLFAFAVGLVAGHNLFMEYPPEARLDEFAEYEEFFVRKECTQQGMMCDNCTSLVFCNLGTDGEWDKYPAGNCGNGTTCRDGQCTANHLPECEEELTQLEFQCTQPGLFPHPYNCKKYFMCIPDEDEPTEIRQEPIEFNCTTGWGYDPLRGACRNKLTNDTCPTTKPVPQCTSIGAQGPVLGNPSLYFICLPFNNVTIPFLFRCNNDLEFFDGACRDPTPVGVVNGLCTRVGNFADPANCRNYKECTTLNQPPLNRTCSLNYKFMPKTSKCEIFPCNCY